jgi:hypothetical protein
MVQVQMGAGSCSAPRHPIWEGVPDGVLLFRAQLCPPVWMRACKAQQTTAAGSLRDNILYSFALDQDGLVPAAPLPEALIRRQCSIPTLRLR